MRALILILILVAGSASANCNLRSARIGHDLIAVGDSVRAVREAGPDDEYQIENRYGGAAGIRFDFYLRGKTVEVYVRAGKVTRICHRRD